jgi:hypothetical protein
MQSPENGGSIERWVRCGAFSDERTRQATQREHLKQPKYVKKAIF